jgi:hypothetical protein
MSFGFVAVSALAVAAAALALSAAATAQWLADEEQRRWRRRLG